MDSNSLQESYSVGELQLNLCSNAEETEIPTCPACGKSFSKPVTLRRYLKAEHPTLKQRLEQHLQAHAKVKLYICSYYGKGLHCPKVLKTHLCLHTGECPYACKFCDRNSISCTR